MDWITWIFLCLAFVIGLLIGLFADGYKYNTGYKNGLEDKENELLPMIKRLNDEIKANEIDKKINRSIKINGIYPVKEEIYSVKEKKE